MLTSRRPPGRAKWERKKSVDAVNTVDGAVNTVDAVNTFWRPLTTSRTEPFSVCNAPTGHTCDGCKCPCHIVTPSSAHAVEDPDQLIMCMTCRKCEVCAAKRARPESKHESADVARTLAPASNLQESKSAASSSEHAASALSRTGEECLQERFHSLHFLDVEKTEACSWQIRGSRQLLQQKIALSHLTFFFSFHPSSSLGSDPGSDLIWILDVLTNGARVVNFFHFVDGPDFFLDIPD